MTALFTCQQEPYTQRGRFHVREVQPGPEGTVHAWLDDSLLYAAAGGQPSDLGTINGVAVRDVQATETGLLHVLDGPVDVGEAEVVVDWARRFDHMQHHTGQHLLTALAQDKFGWPTTSFHLHPGPLAVCDVELEAPQIASSELSALQTCVNEAIRAAHAILALEVAQETYAVMAVRSRGLPDGHTGPVRLVEIEGIDVNTCGGTHLRNTAEIGAMAMLGTERIRGGTRLFFVAGDRLLARLAAHEAQATAAGAVLSRGALELLVGIERTTSDLKAAKKEVSGLRNELADRIGRDLALETGPLWVRHHDDADLPFLNRIATAVLQQHPAATVWLTGGRGPDGVFVLVGDKDAVAARKDELLHTLEAKGGGAAGRLQGTAAHIDRRDAVTQRLRQG